MDVRVYHHEVPRYTVRVDITEDEYRAVRKELEEALAILSFDKGLYREPGTQRFVAMRALLAKLTEINDLLNPYPPGRSADAMYGDS